MSLRPAGPYIRSRLLPTWAEGIGIHALGCYPEECCGVLTLRAARTEAAAPQDADDADARGRAARIRIHPCRNVQGILHARDPLRHPRDARSGFHLDPQDLLRIDASLGTGEERFLGYYHSHTNSDAAFSREDERQAAPQGVAFEPAAIQVVVSVLCGQIADLRVYAWNVGLGRFVVGDLDLGSPGERRSVRGC